MQADCARCQHLESEREDITEALLALRKKIHADVTIRSHPERVGGNAQSRSSRHRNAPADLQESPFGSMRLRRIKTRQQTARQPDCDPG